MCGRKASPLHRVVKERGLPYDAEELGDKIATSIPGETQLIEVEVVDPDPDQAALTANTVVEQFQTHLQVQIDARIASASEEIDLQIVEPELRQIEITIEIVGIQANGDAGDMANQRQLDVLSNEPDRVGQSITDLRIPALTINSKIVALSAQVDVAVPANVPGSPFEPDPMSSAMQGLFVGLLMEAGLVALIEYLHNTNELDQKVQSLVGAPVLTSRSGVSRAGKWPPRSNSDQWTTFYMCSP